MGGGGGRPALPEAKVSKAAGGGGGRDKRSPPRRRRRRRRDCTAKAKGERAGSSMIEAGGVERSLHVQERSTSARQLQGWLALGQPEASA